MEIRVTSEERRRGSLSQQHLIRATNALQVEGYIILADVIDHDHLDSLRVRMDEDSHRLIADERWGGAGHVAGHLQQAPPPFAPYVFEDIVANPFAIGISRKVLGEGLYNRFYSGNANCPGSGTQPLHADGPPLWPNLQVPHPAASLIINVALVDVIEQNGATEIWPGSHLLPVRSALIDPEHEARRRHVVPPIRACTRKGSLLIRDPRLWHRGVPNHTKSVRHMIAMIHNIRWLQRPGPLLFNKGCEAAFPEGELDHNVIFSERPLSYLTSRYAVESEEK